MKLFICYCLSVALLTMATLHAQSQKDSIPGINQLDKLISINEFKKADALMQLQIKELQSKNSYYALTYYIYYKGKIALELGNKESAIKSVENFAESISKYTDSLKVSRQKYLELGTFYEFIGNNQKALEFNLKALEVTKKWQEATPDYLGIINNNIGIYYTRSGNLNKAIQHTQKALEQYESYPETEASKIFNVHNSLGTMMWYRAKMDSALYYYNNALNILPKLEKTPINKYYRASFLKNNMAGIHNIQGNITEAKQAMEDMISYLGKFLESDAQDSKKEDARAFLFQGIENYAGIYKEQGDYNKAQELLQYAYEQKIKYLGRKSSEVANAKVLLGQIYLAQKEYETSEAYLDEAINMYRTIQGDFNTWMADAYYYKGSVNADLNNIEIAKSCYEKAAVFYKKALGVYYDELYLDFIVNASKFYAKNGYKDKAIKMATDAYNYVVKNQGEKTLLEYYQAVNLAEIHYKSNDFEEAFHKSEKALQILEDPSFSKINKLNADQISFQKPIALLIKSKAEYQLRNNKDSTFLKCIYSNLKEAISVLENKKSAILGDQNISILLEDHNAIFEFSKQIALRLYKETNNHAYLLDVLSIHESMLYNKLRSRLNSQSSIAFGDIPEAILKEEATLKNSLNASLNNEYTIESFFKADKAWGNFLENLRINYPKYYELRYASISKSFNSIKATIKPQQTYIRYMFIEKQLFAFLITAESVKLFELDASNLDKSLAKLETDNALLTENYKLYHNLYQRLWQPLEKDIKTKKIIIIPDGILFNLSFEMLASNQNPNSNYIENSILSTYNLSYNYSLFLINGNSDKISYKNNFIAFAPEFSDKMKQSYKLQIQDSFLLDKAYLSLLKQPFTVDLAKEYSKLFNGKSFLNETASKEVFTSEAKEHKIIYIGTHAESNNISPELSRLIFAKSASAEDNSLYTYEIYNQNLASNLTILTACETGKPTYQSGEGMISLTHAFHYAGSESILTSLWKIDEQSSTQIIDFFYKNISKGLAKDEALKLAKLDYLQLAQGRAKHPQYWAGLVLIGDTSPIELENSFTWLFWLLGALVILAIAFFIQKKAANKN